MRFLTYEGLDSQGQEVSLEKVRAAIERGDFKSPDVRKLGAYGLYRAKLSDAARVILKFVQHRGETACLALEVLPRHEYERSRFLRGVAIDEDKLVERVEPEQVEAAAIRYLHPSRPRFHLLDKPLSFDDSQEEVLARPPPLLIVGSAGSGKTALMLQKLRQQPGRVAYVTESSWLAQTARGLYVAHDWDPGEQEPDFLSYTQLLESVEVPSGRPVTYREFRGFFERHRGRLSFTDPHRCFEELRGVVTSDPRGLLSLEDYLALGVRQSIFSAEQRAALYAILPAWQRWLDDAGLYEPNLVAHAWLAKATPRYDFVAVDEVQDLTPVQLSLVLRTLKTPGAFLLGGDANQVVHPNFFSWAKLKSLFWQTEALREDRNIASLHVSYRNGEAVTDLANTVLKVKHARFGSVDRESTSLMSAVGGLSGEVRGLPATEKALAELNTKVRGSTKVAVVVLRDEHKVAARAHLRTPLVFSIHEAKGLEYENVILYRVVSSERQVFAELAEGISAAALAKESLEYCRAKDKADKSLEAFKFYVNALYVAVTRAVKNLWLVEDDPSHPLLTTLQVPFGEAAQVAQLTQSSIEDWQREARRLEQQGKVEQAEAIVSTVLKVAAVPWTVLDMRALPELASRALDPKGVSAKARHQLFDYAALHAERALLGRLREVGYERARDVELQAPAAVKRALQPYEAKNFKSLLWDTEKYGVDFRTPMNLTPLMMAAHAGNVPLVEALLARGASLDARDHLGHLPLHWAIRGAYQDAALARTSFGVLYDLLAPASFDVKVEGRLVQVGRETGEFFLFHCLLARWGLRYTRWGRLEGLTAAELASEPFEVFPEVVVKAARKKRTYLNHVFARSEVSSSYPSSRQLWLRERQGHYVPNPDLSLRVTEGGVPGWKPILELLNLAWLESSCAVGARGRLLRQSPERAAG